MKIIDIHKMPVLRFAQMYESDTHNVSFMPSNTTIELAYLSEGTLEITKGTEKYTAEKGDIICAIRDVNTSAKATSFHCHHVVGVDTLWEFTDDHAAGLHIPYVTKHCPETEEITHLIDEFIYSSHIYESSQARTAELFLSILCKIDKISRKRGDFYQPEYSLVAEKAKSFIQRNINKPISQKVVAEHLGISPSYLCSVFKKTEGITLIKYVNTIKLRGVENLVKKEKFPLYKAAEMYGYSDANYVSTLYKKLFGRNITSITNEKKA